MTLVLIVFYSVHLIVLCFIGSGVNPPLCCTMRKEEGGLWES